MTLPDGTPLCDSAGRPIKTAANQEVLVDMETLKPVLDSRGQPVITEAGRQPLSMAHARTHRKSLEAQACSNDGSIVAFVELSTPGCYYYLWLEKKDPSCATIVCY